jgi:hypothetical protein
MLWLNPLPMKQVLFIYVSLDRKLIPMHKTNVLYIASSARSGSTILDRTLGNIEGFFATGEINNIWEGGLLNNELCGCGTPFRSCDFWTRVMDHAFGGLDKVDPREILALSKKVARMRFIPQALSSWRTRQFHARYVQYCDILQKLYHSIQAISGARVIVDSSKVPALAYILNTIPTIDLCTLHLVRDSRAVCYSSMKKKVRPEVTGKLAFMGQVGPIKGACYWSIANALFEPIRYMSERKSFIRYEDFIANPQKTINSILASLKEETSEALFTNNQSINLKHHHTIAGNPMRFKQGDIKLALDDEWKEKMSNQHKLLVTLLTFPLLFRYKYI